MPRVAKTKVKICAKCNGQENVDKFTKLVEEKNVSLVIGCTGQGKCRNAKPFCRLERDKTIIEADTYEALAEMIS